MQLKLHILNYKVWQQLQVELLVMLVMGPLPQHQGRFRHHPRIRQHKLPQYTGASILHMFMAELHQAIHYYD